MLDIIMNHARLYQSCCVTLKKIPATPKYNVAVKYGVVKGHS